MERIVLPKAALGDEVTRRFERVANECIGARGRFSCALTGGSTVAFYAAFKALKIDWSRVHVFWGDERAVPPDDAGSNFRAANEAWLAHVAIPAAQIHRIEAERPDLGAVARQYAELVATPIDLVHVGVGPDGHVCSLFPGHAASNEWVHRAISIEDSPKPPPRRVTITMRTLSEARALWLFAVGAEKADAVARAIDRHDESLPAGRAAAAVAQTTWFLDDAAASKLRPSDTKQKE